MTTNHATRAAIDTVALPFLPPAIRWLPAHLAACLEGREELRIEAIIGALEDGEFPSVLVRTAEHLRDACERLDHVDLAVTWLLCTTQTARARKCSTPGRPWWTNRPGRAPRARIAETL